MQPLLATRGLTAVEAERRLGDVGLNELPTQRRPNFLRQVWVVLREPMILLLLAAAGVSFLLTEPIDSAILMASVVFVVVISLYQQRKTENALAALRDLSAPRALVVRDGVEVRIPGRDVVPGDLVILGEGDRVPADGVAAAATNLRVDESTLTGESVPVAKGADPSGRFEMGPPGGEGTPWVFSGTLVVGGHAEVVVVHTGSRTEFGRIGHALSDVDQSRTRLQREFDRLVVIFASVAFTTAVLVVVIYGLTRGDWLQGALAGITTAMAVIPEEFPVVFSVFLALGAWRMARRKVLARSTPAI
ncbi:MAG: HAD-IC family P-type ATPase [Candidatus Nanopelagicales bacterium]